ncbi:hypothetical protein CDD83_9306 [Cordyceps sp. RAO-2017]|nr:hypothetical protein CDD83_9306 [Cordyceps sp. RAO-2017]
MVRITIVPASTKTGAATIRCLLAPAPAAEPFEVHALYRNLDKVPPEFARDPRFRAHRADVSGPAALDLAGSDAVLAITPPVLDGRDMVAHAELASNKVKDAIQRSGTVKRLVLLSSVGAQHDTGVGEIKCNNIAERVLATTAVPSISFVRCAYFMENWATGLETLQSPQPFFFSTITPLEWKLPMVAVDDIGSALAAELLKPAPSAPPTEPHVFELHGPRWYSPLDVQAALSAALGRQVAVKPVEPHELHAFFAKVFPPKVVGEWVEMAVSFLPGGIMPPDKMGDDGVDVVRGPTELQSSVRQWLEASAAVADRG